MDFERNVPFHVGHTQLTGMLLSINISVKQQTIKFSGTKKMLKIKVTKMRVGRNIKRCVAQ